MKFKVFVVEDHQCFGDGADQLIAIFENVNEEFMEEVADFIRNVRDVKCRFEEAPQEKAECANSASNTAMVPCKYHCIGTLCLIVNQVCNDHPCIITRHQ